MKIFHRFISTCKVQIIGVQSANEIRVSKGQRKWKKIYLHDNGNQLREARERVHVCHTVPRTAWSASDTFSIHFDGFWLRGMELLNITPAFKVSIPWEPDPSNCVSQYFLLKVNSSSVNALNVCYLRTVGLVSADIGTPLYLVLHTAVDRNSPHLKSLKPISKPTEEWDGLERGIFIWLPSWPPSRVGKSPDFLGFFAESSTSTPRLTFHQNLPIYSIPPLGFFKL